MRDGTQDSGLIMLEAEITTACNRKCKHCYLRNTAPKEMPFEMFKYILKSSAELGVKIFVVTGGEPLIYSRYDELHKLVGEYAREQKIFFYLQSNGDYATEENIQNFGAIQVGYDPLNYVRDSVDLMHLQELNKPVFLFITIYRQLWGKIKKNESWFEHHLESLKKMGFYVMFNTYVGDVRNDPLALTREEYFDVVAKMYDYHERGLLRKPREPYSWLFEERIREAADTATGGCSAGIAACLIDPTGTVYPCPFFRVPAGKITEQDFEEIWYNSPLFKALRLRNMIPCADCEYMRVCGGCRARAYYSKKGYDPYCPLSSQIGQAYDKIFHVYDSQFSADRLYNATIAFIKEVLRDRKFEKILEFGCGNGRFLVLLKEEFGSDVWGVDISQKMVLEARKRTGGKIILGDIRWIRIGEKFDLITSAFDVINHMPPDDVQRFLKNVKRHLAHDGIFVFDSNEQIINPTGEIEQKGHELTFKIDVNGERVEIVEYMYDRPTLEQLLENAELAVISERKLGWRTIYIATHREQAPTSVIKPR